MKLVRKINEQDKIGNRKRYEEFFNDSAGDQQHDKYHFVCNFKRGGISHCNQMGKHLSAVCSFDITSQYPATMREMKVPTGKSWWTKDWNPELYGYYLVKNLCFDLDGKKRFKPVCPIKRSKTESLSWANDYIREGYVDSEMLKYLIEHYNASFEVVKGLVSTRYIKGRHFFGTYINALFDGKAEQDNFKETGDPRYNPALREVIKLFLNAVSGKIVEDSSKYFQVKYVAQKEDAKKGTLNNAPIRKDYGDFKPNLWVGCGVMMYSYSKRLLFEYKIGRAS